MPKSVTCILDDRPIDIGEALRISDPQLRRHFRCAECGQRVRAHKKGSTNQAAHFEHLSRNSKCSLSSPDLFAVYRVMGGDGTREAEALEWAEAAVSDFAHEKR